MAKLFIDIDDTLILYPSSDEDTNPLGIERGLEFLLNQPLVDAINRWLGKNRRGIVVLWSGGGEAYARSVSERFIPGVATWHFTKGGKSLDLADTEDILVDDSPNDLGLDKVDAIKMHPDEFINRFTTS